MIETEHKKERDKPLLSPRGTSASNTQILSSGMTLKWIGTVGMMLCLSLSSQYYNKQHLVIYNQEKISCIILSAHT